MRSLIRSAVLFGRRLRLKEQDHRWLPVAVVIGSLSLTLLLWWGLHEQEDITLRHLVQRQAASIEEEIEDEIQHQALSLTSIRTHWEQLDMSTPARQADAAEYLRNWAALREIDWINAEGEIRWVMPVQRALGLIGQRLNTNGDFVSSRTRALKEDAVVAGAVFTWADGLNGYSLLMPFSTEGHLDGFLRARWSTVHVLQPIVRRHLDMGYTLRIDDHGQLIYDSGESPDPESPVITQVVSTQGLHWTLRAAADSQAIAGVRSYMPTAMLLSGVLLSVLMSGALNLWLVARHQRLEIRDAESALHATLAFQSAILNNAHLAIIATDPDGTIRAFNPAAERMLGYRASEIIGSASPVLLHVEEEMQRRAHELSQELGRDIEPGFEIFVAKPRQGVAEEREWTYVRKDGGRFPVMLSVSALHGSDDNITGFVGIASDITERKRGENEIRHALREKEVLLKEVYHRVKNNLQVVQSLLYLQRRTLPEGLARDVIDDAGQRVRAMALVHEKLYQSRSLALVSLPEYVRDLCQQLTAALCVGGRSIALTTEVDAIEVGLDLAVPLGLLLTELVSNSLKHAFPGERTGKIAVHLVRHRYGAVISVIDTGIGFPAGFDPLATSSLGLKLASSLAQQLGGALQIRCECGAEFRVEVPSL
jgi:PAS domain S-box-containing protein